MKGVADNLHAQLIPIADPQSNQLGTIDNGGLSSFMTHRCGSPQRSRWAEVAVVGGGAFGSKHFTHTERPKLIRARTSAEQLLMTQERADRIDSRPITPHGPCEMIGP
jgi:hypothetical protein